MLRALILDTVRDAQESVALPTNFRDQLGARWDVDDALLIRLQDQPFLAGATCLGALTIPQFRLLIGLTMSVIDGGNAYEREIAGIARDDLIGGLVLTIERRIEAIVTEIAIHRHTRENISYDLGATMPSAPFPAPASRLRRGIRVVVDNTLPGL